MAARRINTGSGKASNPRDRSRATSSFRPPLVSPGPGVRPSRRQQAGIENIKLPKKRVAARKRAVKKRHTERHNARESWQASRGARKEAFQQRRRRRRMAARNSRR